MKGTSVSADVNRELARRFFEEVWNGRDEAAIDRYIAADAAGNDPTFGAGREAFRRQWRQWQAAFPDLHFAVEEIVAEGEAVVTRWRLTGTHTGADFEGAPASGAAIDVGGMSLDHIRDGMIAAGFDGWDELSFRRQLGLL